jgi:hypothetical protein
MGTSVYSKTVTIVFLIWLPRTSRFFHTNGCAFSCDTSQNSSMALARSPVLLKLARFKAFATENAEPDFNLIEP